MLLTDTWLLADDTDDFRFRDDFTLSQVLLHDEAHFDILISSSLGQQCGRIGT